MSIKRDWVRKKKINLTFLRLFDNPFSKYLIFRIIYCMQCLFWVIYQNWKRRLGLAFGAHFFHKNVYLVLYQLAKFKCQTFFPPQDIKQNVLYLYLYIYIFIFSNTTIQINKLAFVWDTRSNKIKQIQEKNLSRQN